MNNTSTPQTKTPAAPAPSTTYTPAPAKDAPTAAKGNDEVMSTPAKKS